MDKNGEFLDFSNESFDNFNRVIEKMPTYETDYPGLRIGDLGIKRKRWYIEGFERFDESGKYLYTDAKGFEIRTPICKSIEDAVSTLKKDFSLWRDEAKKFDYYACNVSLNPFQVAYIPAPPLNQHEIYLRRSPEEKTAHIPMLTYGPDLSFSHPDLTTQDIIDIAKKLTYYSPFIVPFSFSSPFFDKKLWEGLSKRTYERTGRRPAAMVFLKDKNELLDTDPTLTDLARIPAEIGRIEFKAFDAVSDFDIYGALMTLLIGIVLDESLSGRAIIPDENLHKKSALFGFNDEHIHETAVKVFEAAHVSLPKDLKIKLEKLRPMLDSKKSPSHDMIEKYNEGKSINEIIKING